MSVNHDQISASSLEFPLPGERSQVDSALCMFGLARIVGKMLEQLYTTTNRRGGVAKISQLQADLDVWERSLPQTVDETGGIGTDGGVAVESLETFFLRVALCVATVHIHRPALAFTAADPQFSDSLLACGRASARLITLVSRVVPALTDQPLAPQDTVLKYLVVFLYPNGLNMLWQAGLTILFARWKSQDITGSESGDRELVATCTTTLRSFRAYDALEDVVKCADVLDMLLERTFSAGAVQTPVLEHLQWNLWDWPMESALELDNILDAVPLDMQLDF